MILHFFVLFSGLVFGTSAPVDDVETAVTMSASYPISIPIPIKGACARGGGYSTKSRMSRSRFYSAVESDVSRSPVSKTFCTLFDMDSFEKIFMENDPNVLVIQLVICHPSWEKGGKEYDTNSDLLHKFFKGEIDDVGDAMRVRSLLVQLKVNLYTL
jgi:hypothetical protein